MQTLKLDLKQESDEDDKDGIKHTDTKNILSVVSRYSLKVEKKSMKLEDDKDKLQVGDADDKNSISPRRSPRDNRSTKNKIKEASNADLDEPEEEEIEFLTSESESDRPGPSTPKRKRKNSKTSPKKVKRGYVGPEAYAHLSPINDNLIKEVDVMFCGINPGRLSATIGHHYANPTNHFWRCLHRSGLTDKLLTTSEDYTLPEKYNLGLTNLVDRPSTQETELSKEEKIASVPALLKKIKKYRPRIVCFVGKGIWDIVENGFKVACREEMPDGSVNSRGPSKRKKVDKANSGPPVKRDKNEGYALRPYKVTEFDLEEGGEINVTETLFFVMPSTSGRVVSHQLNDKVELFKVLKECVEKHKNRSIDTTAMTKVSI